jgi:hypothetical protein
VVQREGAFGGRVGAADFDAGSGCAEGGHFGGWGVVRCGGVVVVDVDVDVDVLVSSSAGWKFVSM